MAELQDIPRLLNEFGTMAKDYMVQETVGAARKLGRFTGFSVGAGLLWAFAVLLLSVAGLRALVDALPDSPYWEALGYFLFALLLIVFMAIIARVVPNHRIPPPSEEGSP
ncbi:MAG: hypothetical protein EHM57_02460 [Actinobacteria bacterium]|nr:MAG: hypothetical protein EHM57_02460 [Actinomycetota bacterium]